MFKRHLFLLVLLTLLLVPAVQARLIDLEGYKFDTTIGEPVIPADMKTRSGESDYGYYIVQTDAPVTEQWRTQLAANGAVIYGYLNQYAYLIGIQSESSPMIDDLAGTFWMGDYHPAYKISLDIGLQSFVSPERLDDPNYTLIVRVFRDLPGVTETIEALGCVVVEETDDGFSKRLVVNAEAEMVNEIARINDVWWIEEKPEFLMLNNSTRWVTQSNVSGWTPLWDNGITGQGQLATIMDSGVDYNSCWFRENGNAAPGPGHRKVISYELYGGAAYDGCDDGHGTHVAGTMLGDQSYINPGNYNYNGMAYNAKLAVQDVGQDDWTGCSVGAVSVPSSLTAAFNDSYSMGARVHQNSWGSSTNAYDGYCIDIDNAMWNHKDYLVCFAAGNAGPNASTVGSPGTAKSCLTVGACQPAPNQGTMASYSSRGPASDNRRKPTLIAPGGESPNFIASANNHIGNPPSPTCATSSSPFQGTSMATPCVSGMALNIRQYYLDGYYPLGESGGDSFVPMAALIKATLVASTEDMSAGDIPNNNEGWGRILVDNALYFDGDTRELIAQDVEPGLTTNQTWDYDFEIDASTERLVVSLVWSDYPGTSGGGSAIVNDLDLTVTDPGGLAYKGNYFSGGQSSSGGSFDRLNTVECVRREIPVAGQWQVTVTGYNIPQGPQPFALVINGSIANWPEDMADTADERELFDAQSTITAFPNPASSNTTINYVVPANYVGPVRLSIVDVSGRSVRQLVAKGQRAGLYNVTWDGLNNQRREVEEGVYFAKLVAGSSVSSTRIIIQR